MGCHKLQTGFLKVKEETGSTNSFELRLWDSRIGRWISPDPYGLFASPYMGMGNNPINGVDPDGGFWEEFGNWLDGKGWNSDAALEFQDNGGTLGKWVGDRMTGYREGIYKPENGGSGIAVFNAKDDFWEGLLSGTDIFGIEGRVAIGVNDKLSGDVGSNFAKFGLGGSLSLSKMMFIGGDYGYFWHTYASIEGGMNSGISLATLPLEGQVSYEKELVMAIYLGGDKSPNPKKLSGISGSLDVNGDADFIADLSFGAGVTISNNWYLLNLNLGVGLDTSPSVGFNVNTRVIGSTLLTPVKPTLQRNFVEMINNHLYSSPY